ncbi:MAG: signal recognition particle-docking protein FtsY [Pseudobdellovibrionaceae bacterium]
MSLPMIDSHSNAITFLIVFIGVLFFGLVGVLLFSKQKKSSQVQLDEKQPTQCKKASDEVPEKVLEPATIQAPPSPVVTKEAEKETNLDQALGKTQSHFFGRIKSLFQGAAPNFDEIEEVLYTSDLGPKTVERLMEKINSEFSRSEKKDLELVKGALREEILETFKTVDPANKVQDPFFGKFQFASEGPSVWLIVGVNGAGKTTSIGKLAAKLAGEGKKVLVAAGDTFRAAAGNQLRVWTERAQVEIFSPEGVADPSAVAFDAVAMAKSKNYDVVLIDTAGRLHTQSNLMEELKKMKRVIQKVLPEAPHEVLIVLDANSGQNALNQAKEFGAALQLTGAILTKLDGSAKGGVAIGLAYEHKIPIKLIGIGEKISDLRPFSAPEFVSSILG